MKSLFKWTLPYYAHFKSSARQDLTVRGHIYGRLIFFFLIILIFSRIWEAAFQSVANVRFSSSEILWYLGITEWIVLSIPFVHLTIEEDVRSGNLSYHLARPTNYAFGKFFEGLGSVAVRFTTLGIGGFFITFAMAGRLPENPSMLLIAAPLAAASTIVHVAFITTVGICCFWLQDSSPIWWVWQKFMFVLGGLILPLSIYPGWLQEFAMGTPFSAVLYRPASLVLGVGSEIFTSSLLILLWGAVSIACLKFTFELAKRRVTINGG